MKCMIVCLCFLFDKDCVFCLIKIFTMFKSCAIINRKSNEEDGSI